MLPTTPDPFPNLTVLVVLYLSRWVTFTGELGDLELISAFPYSWEVQSLLTSGGDPTPLGGSFSVEFGGYTSEDLPYDASADGLKATLEALPGTGRVDVDKTVLENGKNEWLVTFRDLVGDVDLIAVDGSELTGTSALIKATEVSMAWSRVSTTTNMLDVSFPGARAAFV